MDSESMKLSAPTAQNLLIKAGGGDIVDGMMFAIRNIKQSLGFMPSLLWYDEYGSIPGEGMRRADWMRASIR
eukprot:1852303-Rhodomonas_salina.1